MRKRTQLTRPPEAQTLAKFDPKQTATRLAQGDSILSFAKRVKDWPLLEEAADAKMAEQAAFVAWWHTNVTPRLANRKANRDRGSLSRRAAEQQTKISQQAVSRWAVGLKAPDQYKADILGAAYQAAHLRADDHLAAHFSSASAEWATPQALFDLLDAEFGFTLDVCATKNNAKCPRFFTALQNGLEQSWANETCWMNPPYGDVIAAWMAKAAQEAAAATTVVCLVPARTDTAWWWDTARYGEVRFLRGRLQFGQSGTAPFPSAVVILGGPAQVQWWEAWPP